MNDVTPQYLRDPVPDPKHHLFGPRSTNVLPQLACKNSRFANSFYPHAINSWNNLGVEIRSLDKLSTFKANILSIIKPKKQSIFNILNYDGMKRIYQLRVGLSPLKDHMKAHHFKNTPSDWCSCGTDIETTYHFFLECPHFSIFRNELFRTVVEIAPVFRTFSNEMKVSILLYGLPTNNDHKNRNILLSTIDYILKTGRFDQEIIF